MSEPLGNCHLANWCQDVLNRKSKQANRLMGIGVLCSPTCLHLVRSDFADQGSAQAILGQAASHS